MEAQAHNPQQTMSVVDSSYIDDLYTRLYTRYAALKKRITRPLTLTEKILYLHLDTHSDTELDTLTSPRHRGTQFAYIRPDRVIMQDATAQMALLQFIKSGKEEVALPSSVHCDHLILAKLNALHDLNVANTTNREVYEFLQSTSARYGLDYWQPGGGIIHQVTLEHYALPGMLIIGTDSHTPNAGGMASLAIGVGGADAVDAMIDMPWELKFPRIIGVKLTGTLSPWCSAKDIILKLSGILSVKGGTDHVIEYFGEGVSHLSCTGRATICNMGAEVGATSSLFPYDIATERFLYASKRAHAVEHTHNIQDMLTADTRVIDSPADYYDSVIEIHLDDLEPHINGPYSPDIATPLSRFADFVKEKNYPRTLSSALIGSCTNSSFQDLSRVHSLISQAQKKGLTLKTPLWLSPGSENVYQIIKMYGYLKTFQDFGVTILANACGPCIGQWQRDDVDAQSKNSVITSFNRNFAKRTDGNPLTHMFIASPEIVCAYALVGSLDINPLTEVLYDQKGTPHQLEPPQDEELPDSEIVDFVFGSLPKGYHAPPPPEQRSSISITINPDSERLQALPDYLPYDPSAYQNMSLLIKVSGKCTTDHISMAGPWLKYRGHLSNISKNLLMGATNAFNNTVNLVVNPYTGRMQSVPDLAHYYKEHNIASVIVGDHNYGEGSSREHAAMQPRFLGVRIVIARSFARIHETNLKKQGLLPLTFANPDDYAHIQEYDTISIPDIESLSPGTPLTLYLDHNHPHPKQPAETITANHSLNAQQISWIRNSSALNTVCTT